MRLLPLVAAACLAAPLAEARDKAAISRSATPGDDARPEATEIVVGPQGSDFAFRIEFDKQPWGEDCKTRCALATVFLDTDDNKTTGLRLKDRQAAENGADLALTVQGAREYKEGSADTLLRVRVRRFSDDSSSVDEGETQSELDHRRDPDRLHVEGKTVFVLVDATDGTLPSGPKARVIYHPRDSRALVGSAKGLLARGGGKVVIFKQGKLSK